MPLQRPYPALYFGGSSPAAHDVAAKHVDVYLTWGEPAEKVAAKLDDMRLRVPRTRAARCGSAFACTSSSARRSARHGPRRKS